MVNTPAILDQRLPGLVKPSSTDRLSILIYGNPGVGKTVLAGTAEDDERSAPVLFCDAEKGTMSISHRGRALDVYPMTNFSDDMNQLVEYFQGAKESGNPVPYKTVVIDSLTEAADKAVAGMLAKPNPKRESNDDLAWGEWSTLYNKLNRLVTFFRDLDVHLIMTALEREVGNEVLPSLPGKQIAPKLPKFFNTVARLSVQPVLGADGAAMGFQRHLLLQSDVRYVAKDRSDKLNILPRDMFEPTVTKLLDRIEQGRLAAASSVSAKREKPRLLPTTKPSEVQSEKTKEAVE